MSENAVNYINNEIPVYGVLALGNFDGVHRGHQAVIKAAISYAVKNNLTASALTFEPHPRYLLSSPSAPFRLTSEKAKIHLLRALGISDIITLNFTSEIASLPAKDFVDQILIGKYGARHVVAGSDFVFGHKRGGDMGTLRKWLEPHNIELTEVPILRDEIGDIISSSRIRESLRQGDLATAHRILGRNWSISGEVIHGQKRGKELGFPTANIALGDYLRPKLGVYTVMARKQGDKTRLAGIANIGTRPTVEGVNEVLEFHLFDFHGNIYDQEWEIELHDFIRPELTFPSLEALQKQIAKDVKYAKDLMKTEI